MKYNNGILAFVLLCMSHVCMAVPITNLVSTDPNILVGEQFQIEVWLDNDVTNEQLLAFGFDLTPVSPLLNYAGYTIGSGFIDVSFAPNSMQGISFPGTTGSSVLFATLFFDAVGVGILDISIQGIYDGILSGAYYETLGFNIAATTSIVVNPQAQNVNEPALLMLIMMSVILLLRRKVRMKSNVNVTSNSKSRKRRWRILHLPS